MWKHTRHAFQGPVSSSKKTNDVSFRVPARFAVNRAFISTLGKGDPMPLSINVGLSRKASKDYQSTGVSINVCAELDQSLLGRPAELQQQIEDLYRQAQHALDQHGAAPAATPAQGQRVRRPSQSTRSGSYARSSNGNGHGNGNGNGRSNGGGMTDSQRRAIDAIANRLQIDAYAEAREIVGELDQLNVRQASELIDHLKGLTPANGH
jgi:hypothetical protein